MCLPLSECGLGLRNLFEVNCAFNVKHFWRFYFCKDPLWNRWLHVNYVKCDSIWTLICNSSSSWIIKMIFNCRQIFRPFIHHCTGTGTDIFFWHDCWYEGRILSNIRSSTNPFPFYHAKVSDVENEQGWAWPNSLIQIPPLNFLLTSNPDKFVWKLGVRNQFVFAELFDLIRTKGPTATWHNIVWFKGFTTRQAFILWLACWDRLTIKYRVLSWGVNINPVCSLCHLDCETRDHLFFQCVFARRIWRVGLRKCQINQDLIFFEDILDFLTPFKLDHCLKAQVLKHFFAASTYFIWLERNQY